MLEIINIYALCILQLLVIVFVSFTILYFDGSHLGFVIDIANFFDDELEVVVPRKRLVDQV